MEENKENIPRKKKGLVVLPLLSVLCFVSGGWIVWNKYFPQEDIPASTVVTTPEGPGIHEVKPPTETQNDTVQDEHTDAIVNAEVETTKKEIEKTRYYFIVGGLFGVEQNADRLVQKFKNLGYSRATKTMKDGYFLACFGRYKDRKEAEKDLQKVKAEVEAKAWIYEK